MPDHGLSREIKKGSAELLVLAVLDEGPRHGYQIARQIESRSKGAISFRAASLYPMLYRFERRGLIQGRWVEKSGQRRRRYYRLTVEGQRVLAAQRSLWAEFINGLRLVTKPRPA